MDPRQGLRRLHPARPWIETDLDTDSLNITTWVDGDVVQEGNTSEMHYSPVAEQVAAASEIFTLLPGDVLLTGTPPASAYCATATK